MSSRTPTRTARRAGAPWPAIHDWPDLDDGYSAHAPVNAYRPNAFGIHNVHGNVYEWCLDDYGRDAYLRTAAIDPVFDQLNGATRVFRGGSFQGVATVSRSAARVEFSRDDAGRGLGLRPAREFRATQ